MIKIGNRSDIGVRTRQKSLRKLNETKKEKPQKFIHDMSEHSTYLNLDWDYKNHQLNPGKLAIYKELKAKYGDVK